MDLTEGHVLCSHGSNALRIAFLEKINNEEAVKAKDVHNVFVLVLSLHRSAVTVSSTGAENQIQGDDNGHVGRPCEVSLAPPCPELFCELRGLCRHRTSDRGHVAEVRNQGHRSGGVPIRVSKETLLPLNVHWCSVSSTKMLKTVH